MDMAYVIRMPKLGMEMDKGTLLEWNIEDGGEVVEGEVIAEVESEKSVGEIEAREDGVLREIYLAEGETAEPSTPIGILAESDEDITDLRANVGGESVETTEISGQEQSDSASASTSAIQKVDSTEQTDDTPTQTDDSVAQADIKASPRAKQRAEELGVDLATVEGTGPQGAITADDVDTTETADETQIPMGRTVSEERPFDGMRRTIADRLSQSYRDAVHVTEHREVDAEALLEAVNAADEAYDTDVSMPDLLILAVSAALSDHPAFNATFEDGVHRLYKEHNICIAVDVEAGLIAPVLREIDEKQIEEIAANRRELTERALSGEYTMDDLRGGTFTVTNLGVLGVESFDPVINPPQVAILGVNAIQQRAVPADEGMTFRSHLPLDLSFDHRVVDGADAARFLASLAGHIENPWPLLL
jgi:pyruvate dehydrogenase complex dihydrolipoamide acetyltransferase long form